MDMREIGDRTRVPLGDDVFFIQKFPVFEGMRVLGELQKLLLPSIGGLAAGADLKSGKLEGEGLVAALMLLSENLNSDKMEKLSQTLLNEKYISVKVGGKGEAIPLDEETLNLIFTGRYFDVLVLMYYVAKVNYMDFSKLKGLPTGLVTAVEKIKRGFLESLQETSSEQSSSTEPLKAE